MILYDKSGQFIGMTHTELNLLGYDDMEAFCNEHTDIADLFVNKAGYIFKFKNFSWIDYLLYSGAPHKHAIIRTKNGKEVEVLLAAREFFLPNLTLWYSVELTVLQNSLSSLHEERKSQGISEPQISSSLQSSMDASYKEAISHLEYESIDQIKPEDLDFSDNQDTTLLDDTILPDEPLHELSFQNEDDGFDIEQCAKALGIDIATLRMILDEYIVSFENGLLRIQNVLSAENFPLAKEEVVLLKNLAFHLKINPLLEALEELEFQITQNSLEERLLALENLKNAYGHFKRSIA